MPKIITITNIEIREMSLSYIDGKWNVSVVYCLVDESGIKMADKRDQIIDAEITTAQKNYLNNILTAVTNKIKQREGIV